MLPKYACQRSTRLCHHNEHLTRCLEVLEENAIYRDSEQDYKRALAFRRASCVLKSLPFQVTTLKQANDLRHLKHMGDHVINVIKAVIEDGFSTEVEKIEHDDWFKKMKLLKAVFGVGVYTANQWINMGVSSIADADARTRSDLPRITDSRVQLGLEYYDDLETKVSRSEANAVYQLVKTEAEAVLPGVIVLLMGGFRRGKSEGHDIDILLSHPDEGEEERLLHALLRRLASKNIIISGRHETNSFKPSYMREETRTNYLRSTLDHYEKWMGVIRVKSEMDAHQQQQHHHGNIMEERSPSVTLRRSPRKSQSVELQREAESQDASQTSVRKRRLSLKKTISKSRKRESAEDGKASCDVTTSQIRDDVHTTVSGSHTNEEQSGMGCSNTNSRHDGEISSSAPSNKTETERDWIARRLDLIVAPMSQFYFAVVGWTGSKQFNRDLRTYADKEMKMKLSSHGIYSITQGSELKAKSEEDVFKILKIPYLTPEDRNC